MTRKELLHHACTNSCGEMIAEQPAVAGDAVAAFEQAQTRPEADGIVREHRLAKFALQPLDDAHRRPVAAGHDNGVRVRPVRPAAKLIGLFRTDPAEPDRKPESPDLAVAAPKAPR